MQCSHGGRLVGRIEVMNDARSLGRTCTGISGEATNRGIDGRTVLTGGTPKVLFVTPNVRAKRATTAWRAGQQAQNGPQAQPLMASATCRWRSA